ncbi:NADPH-dependent FMN reductase [Pseudooceanicola nanhaiensis]|uniref:NADPH-dependent FMN reductase n=1 Tax=Pseudooceanicola nanhaiensis TaxID=375761 RepID=UPI001CD3C3FE|nr:NADPH-dependent FMN reductase [Pseudooceanicola nanhaiensis]MCA0923025.1 NAD(P)H-dependent oxidoreductase [Pseudooceanicola nanhaiensis]
MTTILGLSGSLRAKSYNAALLRAAIELCPAGTTIHAGTIAGVPLYNADEEAADGAPASVVALREQLAAADALLLVTPEYNNGVPGVFKNAIDWMSSGEGAALFRGKPVGVIGTSPGGFGTLLSQAHWLQVLRALSTRPYQEGRLVVSKAGSVFDETGALTDAKVQAQLRQYLEGFVDAIG